MRNSLQITLGEFIKTQRTKKNITQKQLAKLLHTTQSAVARMEKGEQNFTASLLEKISEALQARMVSVNTSLDFQINGGKKLSGKLVTNASKNGTLAVMAASLLNRGSTTLSGVPKIEEVSRFCELFSSIGVKVEWQDEKTLKITPPTDFNLNTLDREAASRIRVSLYLLPALCLSQKSFILPQPGGCRMGSRTILPHQLVLESFGMKVQNALDGIKVTAPKKPKPAQLTLFETSDTATVNALIMAAGIPGMSKISFASFNYMVQEACYFLEALGVDFSGIGTSELVVTGLQNINKDITWHLAPDPIESMMFLTAGILTDSTVTVCRCPVDFLKLELQKLRAMGQKMKISAFYLADNGKTKLVDITIYPSKLKNLPDKLHAQPYPGINTDNLPFFVPIAAKASGSVLVHDWMWENRAIYFTELNKLGAKVNLLDPHRVTVEGPTHFRPAQVVCPPALRPAVIIFLAMLAAPGISILRNVYSIKRGYEDVAKRLNAAGADIQVLTS